MSTTGPSYLVTPDGTYQIRDCQEADDVMLVITECYADKLEEPLQALTRQQVATRLGHGLPESFPIEDVVGGDPNQTRTRLWWDSTVQRYLAAQAVNDEAQAAPTEDAHEAADLAAPE